MMLTYVTLPARLVGIRPTGSRVDKLAAAAIGGGLGALVCTPPYVIGRIGILLLGSQSSSRSGSSYSRSGSRCRQAQPAR